MVKVDSSGRVRDYGLPCDERSLARIFIEGLRWGPVCFYQISLVSKAWRKVITGDLVYHELYHRIAPEVCGREDHKKYLGGDPGEEPRIPFEYLFKFESGKTLLVLKPTSLKFTRRKRVVEELCTFQNMGKWALHAKGFKMGYHEVSKEWILHKLTRKFELQIILAEEAHWYFREVKELVDHQPSLAIDPLLFWLRRPNLWTASMVSETLELVHALFMTYAKTGKLFTTDPHSDPHIWFFNELN